MSNLPAMPSTLGVPTFDDGVEVIYDYVTRVAEDAGVSIPINRGVPGRADPRAMLEPQEKAVMILGRAIGASYDEIAILINEHREREGREICPTGYNGSYTSMKHKAAYVAIMGAIQTAILRDIELYSPLVSGVRRFMWRAQMLEWLRRRHQKAVREDNVEGIMDFEMRIRTHMKWFDDVGVSGDVGRYLVSPADAYEQQSRNLDDLEREIEQEHKDGKISEMEMLERLRELRHGS